MKSQTNDSNCGFLGHTSGWREKGSCLLAFFKTLWVALALAVKSLLSFSLSLLFIEALCSCARGVKVGVRQRSLH